MADLHVGEITAAIQLLHGVIGVAAHEIGPDRLRIDAMITLNHDGFGQRMGRSRKRAHHQRDRQCGPTLKTLAKLH